MPTILDATTIAERERLAAQLVGRKVTRSTFDHVTGAYVVEFDDGTALEVQLLADVLRVAAAGEHMLGAGR